MKISEAAKISRSINDRSRVTAAITGILLGCLLAGLLIVQGLENISLRYAGEKTEWHVHIGKLVSGQEIRVFDSVSKAADYLSGVNVGKSREEIEVELDTEQVAVL